MSLNHRTIMGVEFPTGEESYRADVNGSAMSRKPRLSEKGWTLTIPDLVDMEAESKGGLSSFYARYLAPGLPAYGAILAGNVAIFLAGGLYL